MPSAFMPNGMVPNHSSAGSLSVQYCGDAMKASIVPLEAASKQSNGGMISPPERTSIRNRPPLISSTTLANRWAAPMVHVERRSERGRHAPLDLRLRDDVWSLDDGRGSRSHQRATRLQR